MAPKRTNTSYQKGLLGEWIASFYLMLKGYRILRRRYKTKVGEIDIIAQKGDAVIFVEVKKRSSFEEAAYAITSHQRQRLLNAARWFLTSEAHEGELRFDAILLVPWRMPWHIRNIIVM